MLCFEYLYYLVMKFLNVLLWCYFWYFSSVSSVARWWRKAWYLETRGFIPKKIQWHIHAGPWSLVNWWREALMRHYIRCSWILMRAAVGLTDGLGLDGDRCIRVIPRHHLSCLSLAFKTYNIPASVYKILCTDLTDSYTEVVHGHLAQSWITVGIHVVQVLLNIICEQK